MQEQQLEKDSEQTTLFDYPHLQPVAVYLLQMEKKMTHLATPIETLLQQLIIQPSTVPLTSSPHPSISTPPQTYSPNQQEEEEGWYYSRCSACQDQPNHIEQGRRIGERTGAKKRRIIKKQSRKRSHPPHH